MRYVPLECDIHIAVNGPFQVEVANLPGDGNKRDPERDNWPCRVILPILPIQSISGSHLLPSPGRTNYDGESMDMT